MRRIEKFIYSSRSGTTVLPDWDAMSQTQNMAPQRFMYTTTDAVLAINVGRQTGMHIYPFH